MLAGWFGDIITEATFIGKHTRVVQKSLKLGFWCFLASEGMFFFSFFWAYLFNAINPYDCFGGWPPKGIEVIDCLGIPILNTAILIVSGLVVTWAIAAVKQGIFWEAEQALALSIGLGIVFEVLQGYEYWICRFTLTDGVFGSCFYTLTGLHGLHVMGGILFLCVGLGRLFFKHFSPNRHLGLDFAVWYWHFVDVVWVFLYLLLYVHPHFIRWINR